MHRTPEPLDPLNESWRVARIARIRREIALGIYETPEKLAAALDRLATDVGLFEDDDEPLDRLFP